MPPKESIYYDKIYSENEAPFGKEPEPEVLHILDHKTSDTVLDLGAGEGRNSLYLAKAGFDVTAEDISPVGIQKIRKYAKENDVRLHAEVKDIRSLDIEQNFDVVVCSLVLHNITKEKALEIIKQMKDHTNPNGLNAISTFTENGDFYRDPARLSGNFYPKENELKDLYADWGILEYEETKTIARAKKTRRKSDVQHYCQNSSQKTKNISL